MRYLFGEDGKHSYVPPNPSSPLIGRVLYSVVVDVFRRINRLKEIRYVHHVNPVTGVDCTTRIVVTDKDVTLWQVDKVITTEAMFDEVDTDEVGMICLTHPAFKEAMNKVLDIWSEIMAVIEDKEAEV